MNAANRRSWFRFAFKVIVLLFSTGLGLLIAEVGVRAFRPQPLSIWSLTRDGLVVHRSNVSNHLTSHGKRFETNSVGMRDREHSRSKPDGVFRILLFGDSFMEANQVAWKDSFAMRLEGEIESRTGKRAEVINLSVSGWGTDAELAYFERYAADYEPDLVLVGMTVHNDVSDNLAMQYHFLDGPMLVRRERTSIPIIAWTKQRIQEGFAGNSHLYQLAARTFRAEQVREGVIQLNWHVVDLLRKDPPAKIDDGWRFTFLLFDRIRRLADDQDAGLAVFLIPMVHQVSEPRLERILRDHEVQRAEVDPLRPQRLMKDWGETQSVEVIDLEPAFKDWIRVNNKLPYLEGDGHWDEDGHDLAAKLVGARLSSSLISRPH